MSYIGIKENDKNWLFDGWCECNSQTEHEITSVDPDTIWHMMYAHAVLSPPAMYTEQTGDLKLNSSYLDNITVVSVIKAFTLKYSILLLMV